MKELDHLVPKKVEGEEAQPQKGRSGSLKLDEENNK